MRENVRSRAKSPLPPRDSHVLALVRTLHERILRVLRRRGYLEEELARDPDDALMAQISAASGQGRVALGPDAGAPIRRFRSDPESKPTFVPGELCADWEGFSLHAKIRTQAHQRERLERLCCYVARPPIVAERLSLTPDGRHHARRLRTAGLHRARRRARSQTEKAAPHLPRSARTGCLMARRRRTTPRAGRRSE